MVLARAWAAHVFHCTFLANLSSSSYLTALTTLSRCHVSLAFGSFLLHRALYTCLSPAHVLSTWHVAFYFTIPYTIVHLPLAWVFSFYLFAPPRAVLVRFVLESTRALFMWNIQYTLTDRSSHIPPFPVCSTLFCVFCCYIPSYLFAFSLCMCFARVDLAFVRLCHFLVLFSFP